MTAVSIAPEFKAKIPAVVAGWITASVRNLQHDEALWREISFIFAIVGISLSGVMAPGPITAAALAAGEWHRHAGAWICGGHIAAELPLILLLAAGLGTFLEVSANPRGQGPTEPARPCRCSIAASHGRSRPRWASRGP